MQLFSFSNTWRCVSDAAINKKMILNSIILIILFDIYHLAYSFDMKDGDMPSMPGGMAGMDQMDMSAFASQMGGMPNFGGLNSPAPVPKGPSIPVEDTDATDKFSQEELNSIDAHEESHEFQAETHRLLDIIINALYADKEIFLRELISNASDALEKTRFKSLKDSDILKDNENLDIKIEYNNDEKTLSITDAGIGMTKQELISNLGTVAKSGTANFLEALAQGGDMSLIGQFGVGFYSAFLVADKVTVTSKSPESDKQYIWRSSADASYTVIEDPRGVTIPRGTRVTMHLKEDSTELLNENKLKDLARKYSQYIQFPIYVKTETKKKEEVPIDDTDEDTDDDVDVKEDDADKPKTKSVETVVREWEQVNAQKAIWVRPKEEITPDEYIAFYKSISRDYSPPLTYLHFAAEGEIEFKSILYIPSKAPSDMFENYYQKQSSVKLYARRVLVADKFEKLIPKYLSFICGVVDSDDFPLNVSREQLQQAQVITVVSKKIVRKILDTIKRMSNDYDKRSELKKELDDADEGNKADAQSAYDEAMKYKEFNKEFSRNLKLGCYEDDANRSKIAKLLRFNTSEYINEDVSLDQYVSRMKGDQKKIYYASGESNDQILASPQLQLALQKGYEVLLFTDPMSESCILRMTDYEGNKLVSLQKGELEYEKSQDEKSKEKLIKKMYEPLTSWFKKQLGTKVMKIEVSKRLVDSPCAIVTAEHGYSAYMEKMMKAQTFVDKNQMKMMQGSRILEINPKHSIIKNLLDRVKNDSDDEELKEYATSLFDAAVISSGFDMDDPTRIAKYVFKTLRKDLDIPSGDEMVSDDIIDSELKIVEEEEQRKKEEKKLEKERKEKEKKAKQEEEARIAAEAEAEGASTDASDTKDEL